MNFPRKEIIGNGTNPRNCHLPLARRFRLLLSPPGHTTTRSPRLPLREDLPTFKRETSKASFNTMQFQRSDQTARMNCGKQTPFLIKVQELRQFDCLCCSLAPLKRNKITCYALMKSRISSFTQFRNPCSISLHLNTNT